MRVREDKKISGSWCSSCQASDFPLRTEGAGDQESITRLPLGLNEDGFSFPGVEVLEMLTDGDGVSRQGQEGTDIGERLQDEAPIDHAWMGNDENAGIDDASIIVEDIDIDDAGGIGRAAWLASEVEFYALGILKEFGGFPDVIELDDGVEEIGGVFRAVDRFTPVDGSLFEMDSLGRQVPDKIAGRSQVANSVAEVRPQRYSYPGCHFKILLMQFSCRVWPDRGGNRLRRRAGRDRLPEAQDVLHVIQAGIPVPEPESGPQGA